MYTKIAIFVESCLQTVSVCINEFVLILGPAASVLLIWFVFFYTRLWWCIPLYFLWYVYDFESPKYGSHVSASWRQLRMFNYFVKYFPISLRKTAELNPSKNYLIVNHPHGIMSIGVFGNFSTDATNFSRLYPGVRPYLCTLGMNFLWPLRREYMELLGAVSCSRESIGYLISRPEGGNAVVIVAGGAEEALVSQPDTHRIVLRKRKGFVKVAIQYGTPDQRLLNARTHTHDLPCCLYYRLIAHQYRLLKNAGPFTTAETLNTALVPSYSFGEVDIFRQLKNEEGSTLRRIQNAIGNIFTFTTPLFYGRGALGLRFGFIPFQRPICTVVGCPIEIEKNENPTDEELSRVHDRYVSELLTLFEEHKSSFGIPESVKLEIL